MQNRPPNANAKSPGASVGRRPVRVLHLGNPNGLYGAERWILALIRHLPISEIESIVGVIRDVPGPEPEIAVQAKKLGFRSHTFEAYGKVSWAAVAQLRGFILSNGIDVLHTHGYKTDILGAFAVCKTHCAVMSTPHGWSTGAGVRLQMYEAANRLAFLFHDAVAPLSPDLHSGLAWLPGLPAKLHSIRNGVDISEVDEITDSDEELQLLKRQGKQIVGYIGQLIPRKGINGLLRAFSSIESPDALLCIVGEGPQRAELEALALKLGIAERTRFHGYRADRIRLLKCFDMFVLPSALEGIPRCVLESMAAAVPVIATDIPGCRDVVVHGETGLLFGVGDVPALAAAIETLLTDPGQGQRMAQVAGRFVREEYSAVAMARRYADLYRIVVAKTGQRVGGALPRSKR